MKNALDWIKSNPISVAAAAVAVVGLVVFAYFYVIAAPGWSKNRSAALAEPLQKQNALPESVPLPNEDPNAEPDNHTIVVNQKVIESVKTIYNDIRRQYDTILNDTGNKNAAQHRGVLLGRGAIWPDNLNFSLGQRAKEDYLLQHAALFTYGKDEGWNMPSMVASNPPHPTQIQRTLARTAFNFINSIGVTSAGELTQTQAELLYAEQRTVLMSMLTTRARQIHLYVDLPRDQDIFAPEEEDLEPGGTGEFDGIGLLPSGPGGGINEQPGNAYPAGYPFRLDAWAFASDEPEPDEIWEAQVKLWIIRDIMRAIHEMNNVGETVAVTRPTGEVVQEPASAINSPIKRLLRLDPLPGYVGLHTVGGVPEPNQVGPGGSDTDSGFGSPTEFGGDLGLGSPATRFDPGGDTGDSGTKASVYPNPPSDLTIPEDPTEAAPEHFGITPTGRVSNSAFDVRHTRLIIDIEWDKLPAFIEQLRKTNFMTVVKANLQDIDEYQVLREGGYVYGDADVVRAELIVESLWFRNWTAEYMPKIVKQKLLMIPADDSGFGDGFGSTGDELGY